MIKNSSVPALLSLFIAAVLMTAIFSYIPATKSQPLQSSAPDVSQVVKQIAERVASANPGTETVFVEQILTELAKQSSQATNQGNILEEIFSQVLTYPYGVESQSLARFAGLLSTDSSVLLPIVQKILQDQEAGNSPTKSIVNIAVQDATGGGKNVNDEIALAAQIIAKLSPDIPVRNIESIIIQMALEISRAQGKAISGQTVFEVAHQIKLNPNGVLTQAILQLAKQDTHDNGKTGQTIETVKTIVSETKKSDSPEKTSVVSKSTPNKKTQGSIGPIQPGPIQPAPVQPGPVPLPRSQESIVDEILGGTLRSAVQFVLGNEMEKVQTFYGWMTKTLPLISELGKQKTIAAIVLPTARVAGPDRALGALDNIQTSIPTNPNVANGIGKLAALYETGNDVAATESSNMIADRIALGSEPSMAISETPFPGSETVIDSLPENTITSEVKSLPPSGGDTTLGNGTDIVEPSSPVQMGLYQEPISPGESAFYPGVGLIAPQPNISPIPPSETALLLEPTSPVEPGGTDLSFSASPSGLGIPADVECLGNLELCVEPTVPSPSPVIDPCQEQWYLPECTQNGNEMEEDNLDEAAPVQAPDYDEGGYQQLPYYYEPEGYLEGEDQYSEDGSNEEDDYEGGYQEYEQDYSEEEDSGDEEDDYEEVGNYQEEEENYSEEEVADEDGGEEEDFTEEEEESGEYNEE